MAFKITMVLGDFLLLAWLQNTYGAMTVELAT